MNDQLFDEQVYRDTCPVRTSESVLPSLELPTASKACYRLQSLLPPPAPAAASKAYYRLHSLLPPSKLTVASRACYHLQSLLPPPELAAASRLCCCLQNLVNATRRRHHTATRLTRPTCKARSHPRQQIKKRSQTADYEANPRPGLPAGHGANLDLTSIAANQNHELP